MRLYPGKASISPITQDEEEIIKIAKNEFAVLCKKECPEYSNVEPLDFHLTNFNKRGYFWFISFRCEMGNQDYRFKSVYTLTTNKLSLCIDDGE